jgi:hypothetical protein
MTQRWLWWWRRQRGGQVAADVKETWHGVREALHHVHRSIDHVIDAL